MAVVSQRSGCKVGWVTVDNLAEADWLADQAAEQAARMHANGYDFGYQMPGSITENADGTFTVVTP